MAWHFIHFPPKTPYSEGVGRVLVGFLREFFANYDTKGLALFKSRRSPAGEMLYLTPRAAERCRVLIAPFDPRPCEAPPRSEVSLVAGDMSANALLKD